MSEKKGLRTPSGKRLIWLLKITWKRRKGKPTEYIGGTTGGVLQVLMLHKHVCKQLKVPESWMEFKLHGFREARKLAPDFMKQFEQSAVEVRVG